MLISDFDYELPQALIARYPARDRRGSRLLAVTGTGTRDLTFSGLPGLLRPGDLLVFNDTRVIRARLDARKETGGRVEIPADQHGNLLEGWDLEIRPAAAPAAPPAMPAPTATTGAGRDRGHHVIAPGRAWLCYHARPC